MHITIPTSSTNIKPNFNYLNITINLPFHLNVKQSQKLTKKLNKQHPTNLSFITSKNSNPLFTKTSIPPKKKLNFSKTAHVTNLTTTSLQHSNTIQFPKLLTQTKKLKNHFNNVTTSIYKNLTTTNNKTITKLQYPPNLNIII